MSAGIGSVGYLVAAFGALGCFFPASGEGHTAAAAAGASIVVWVVHARVLRGNRGAAVLNGVVALAKLAPRLIFIVGVSLGLATQPEPAAMKNPSMAPVLERAVGTWATVLVHEA